MSPRKRGRQNEAPPRGPPTAPVLEISAQEVARREIDAAIAMLAAGGDPIAIHVLTMAARDILEAEAKRRGLVTIWEVHVAQELPHHQAGYRDVIKGPYNFMKHGGGAGELLEDFIPSSVGLHLVVAVATYCQVYGEEPIQASTLDAWLQKHEPDIARTF